MIRTFIAWLLVLVCPAIALAETHQVSVPLHDGCLQTRQLRQALQQDLNLSPAFAALVPDSRVSIDLQGLTGSLAVRALNAALGQAFQLTVSDNALTIRFDPQKFPADFDQTCDALDRFTRIVAPDASARQARRFGLFMPRIVDPHRPMVVLIHGLDGAAIDCGDLASLLDREGYQTALFVYPAERPLDQNAQLLAQHLTAAHQEFPGVTIDLVTESMGGLIARQYIEGPDYAGGVDRLVMIAPPNAGSTWAPYSIFLKLAVNARLLRDDPQWSPTWMITEGLCQSGRDLRPGSKFLVELNSRPRRPGVRYTIIAGDRPIHYRAEADALALLDRLIPRQASSAWGLRLIDSAIRSESRDLLSIAAANDGPVTVSSAELAGVQDFLALAADHISLYRSVNGELPAAWPIIENRLAH